MDHGIWDFRIDTIIVSYVGRLVWEKNLSVFANVLKDLTDQGIPHRSLVVGDGPARNVLVDQLTDTVFTGPLEGHQLATAYASSDIFLFPSETETFGNVTLEAMASGLPTVCANASGSDLLVLPEQTGYLMPPHDTSAFVSAIKRLVVNDTLRKQLGKAARERSFQFEWNHVMGHLSSYYEEIWSDSETYGPGLSGTGASLQKAVV